jgi:hypothetical protein
MAIIQVSSDIEREATEILSAYKEYKNSIDKDFSKNFFYNFFNTTSQLLLSLSQSSYIIASKYDEISDKYKIFREVRNQISHGALDKGKITKERLEEIFNDGIEILSLIQAAKLKGIFSNEVLDKAFTK